MREKALFEPVITKHQAAQLLSLRPSTLADARWRWRAGLRAVKIGRGRGVLRFRRSDLLDLLTRGLEQSPPEGIAG